MALSPGLQSFYASESIIRFIWQTSAVSIAATIITFPLTLFYFRQFPNLFIITNLIAVPLSTLIIYTGIMVLAISPINLVFAFSNAIVKNDLVPELFHQIYEQSFAVARGIHINAFEMVVLFFLVISVATFLLIKSKWYFNAALLLLPVFLISHHQECKSTIAKEDFGLQHQ